MQRKLVQVYANIALGLCLVGVALGLIVGAWSLFQPQKVTTADARHALVACEAIALFFGGLAYRSSTAIAAMIIAGVLVMAGLMI